MPDTSPEFPHLPPALKECGAQRAIVLGSGLGSLADSLPCHAEIPYSEIPGLPISKVPGHAGRFLVASLADRPLIIAQGRVHGYEGLNAGEITRSVRLLHHIGVTTLLLTNAAGSVNPDFPPGEWMMLTDHLNLTGESPLRGGANFVDLSEVYCRSLRTAFQSHAARLGLTLHEGVYAALFGPQYETPAEVRMLRILGADAVGMSTVPEAIQARALGLRVAAFSCLTNWGAGLSERTLHHADVSAVGREAAPPFIKLLQSVLPEIS